MTLAFALACTGCSGDDATPERLADGSRTTSPPVELQEVAAPPIMATLRVTDAADVERGSRLATCLRGRLPARPAGPLVERVGVTGESVTFRDASGRWLHACDDVEPTDDREWCGGVSGRLFDGRLRDPRLRLAACATSDGDPVGFAWVEPGPDARYVVVGHPGYAEAHEVAAGLPIRIATSEGVSVGEARATFELTEHDASGTLLRRYSLEVFVAG